MIHITRYDQNEKLMEKVEFSVEERKKAGMLLWRWLGEIGDGWGAVINKDSVIEKGFMQFFWPFKKTLLIEWKEDV